MRATTAITPNPRSCSVNFPLNVPQDTWIIILAFLDAKSYVHLRAVNKFFFLMIPDVINIAAKKAEETIRVENLAIILETAQGMNILQNAMCSPGSMNIFNLPRAMRKPLNQAIRAFSENHPVRAKHIAKSIGVLTTPASETVLRQLATAMPALQPFTEERIQQNKKYAEENGWQQYFNIYKNNGGKQK